MPNEIPLRSLSDDELLRRLSELLRQSRRTEAELVAHIGEVDERRLYAREAAPSMFAYCTDVLHLSEHEAYLRIAAARAGREHPMLLTLLADGRLHLSGIAKLVPHLTRENRDELLERAAHKSKREIEELLAELAPRPDVPALARKLPEPRKDSVAPSAGSLALPVPDQRQGSLASLRGKGRPERVAAASLELGPDRVTNLLGVDRIAASGPAPQRPAVVEALAPARYKVQFTASAALRDKLDRLQALMPNADLAQVLEQAVTEKLERLEARRFGTTQAPRKSLAESNAAPSSRHIPAAIRRVVYARDEGRCSYSDEGGRRCSARAKLEFHHHERPYGRGGDHSPENVRLMCRAHNTYQAERDYGKDVMGRYRRFPDHVSEPSAVYSIEAHSTTSRAARSASGPASATGTTSRSPATIRESCARRARQSASGDSANAGSS